MLYKFDDNEISVMKGSFPSAYDCLLYLLDRDGKSGCSYPSLKYAKSVDEGWLEFELCFHKDRESHYKDLMRPKYKNGNEYYRLMKN